MRRGLYLQLTVPACGPLVPAQDRATVNLEKPAAFTQALAAFLVQVGAGRWLRRDPRARPDEILNTS